MTRRRRSLSEAERALWSKVVEGVEPLQGRRPQAEPEAPPAPSAPVAAAAATKAAKPASPAPGPSPQMRLPQPPPLAPLEPRFRRRLARGVVEIDARIDLHGLRQEEAHRRLTAFLAGAQALGHRVVLVITGKGAPGADAFAERGVLRRSVPIWLGSPSARAIVVGFEPADPVHGGAGALYVRIRKPGRR